MTVSATCTPERDVFLCTIVLHCVHNGTLLLLESLNNSWESHTAGYDTTVINLAKPTLSWAKEMLTRDRLTATEESEERHRKGLGLDFPLLDIPVYLNRLHMYTPLLREGGSAQYSMLAGLYRNVTEATKRDDTPIIPTVIIRFMLLCFHLSAQYFLTPDVVTCMWSEPLGYNSVVTLFTDILNRDTLKFYLL